MKQDDAVTVYRDFKVNVHPVMELEQYPVPHIDDLLQVWLERKKFIKTDLSQAYLQMCVDEDTRTIDNSDSQEPPQTL